MARLVEFVAAEGVAEIGAADFGVVDDLAWACRP